METITRLLPNITKYWDVFVKSVQETLQMVSITLVFVIVFGILLGVVLAEISEGQLYENKVLNAIIPKIVNLIRALPFVIMLAMLIPFTRALMGTAIGVRGALVPMIIGMVPFVSRQIELAIMEVDPGVIEMALSMGYSKPFIVFRILLKEARSGIIRGIVLSSISLVNISTMAGVVGGGGIGDFAIRYGYTRYMTDVVWVCVITLLILVFGIQGIGNLILKKTTH